MFMRLPAVLARRLPRPPRTSAMSGSAQPLPPPQLDFVSAAELRARLAEADAAAARPLVLDVRDSDERAGGSIAGALHVPAHRLRAEGPTADAELDAVLE